MAKDKSTKKAAAPAKAETVKSGRVAKPAEAPKKAAKVTAKNTAKAVEKKKKKAKEPTPEPSSESESESDAATSESSDSSGSESEEEVAAPKTNGAKAKAAKKAESDSEESGSDSSDDSESESEAAPAKAAAPKTNGVNGKAKDDSSDDSDSDSEEEDDEPAKASKDTESSDEEEDDDASDSDSSSDEEEEEAKPEPSKKRKAEAAVEATPKRAKVMVDGEEKEPTANLFIGQLSWNVDEEWLTREFEGFGEIASVRIITDRDSGRSKGFGYVEFADVDNAVKALEEMSGKELDGRNIRVDFSMPRQPRDNAGTPQQRSFDRAQKYGDQTKEPTTTLWVGNISFDADENTLTDAFKPYGGIKAIRLPTDRETGAPKGFGYIEMDSLDDAKAAFESCQGMEVAGRALRLDYASERSNDSPAGGRGGFGGRGGGGFGGRGGGGGRGRGGFGGRGGGRGGSFGGRGGKPPGTNRGGFGDFSGKKTTF